MTYIDCNNYYIFVLHLRLCDDLINKSYFIKNIEFQLHELDTRKLLFYQT
ncbi:MAG: hypothetical protein K0R59_3180 [Sphingobacterium sp.]|jgi:hypothetical protein|nr:hypothetical protein [Sphingobacterium sp.]